MSQDLTGRTAAELGRGIAAGDLDPLDLTHAYFDAIADSPVSDSIYARLTRDRAIAEATAARDRARLGLRRSPLDGVPISWKDLFDTAGVATESGTALLRGRVPGRDAAVLATATHQGLVCLGKTHQTEFAFSGLGLNPVTASPPCVNDPGAVSGGSSSGAATSVAFGLAAAAIGSDTGGSVRIPAAWNDLVGLKTTHGRLSLEGVVPLVARFDTVGPLCRTVEDAALVLAALEGARAPDLAGADAAGLRLAVLETVAVDDIADPQAQAFDAAVSRLAGAGVTVSRLALPLIDEAMALSGVLFAPEAYATWRHLIDPRGDEMFAPVRTRFLAGAEVSAADFIAGWQALDRHRAAYADAVAGYDAVILPTSAIMPPDKARLERDEAYFTEQNLMALRNTRIGNLMGLPVLTLPTGVPSCGLSLQGLPGQEERLLRIGAAVERALA